ncbi:hypothetical protein QAD02_014229 [Eretmocerus hayati]|uniref:Uncharacterized protein n=1 Tax=Eretmocerus hayati TaxID=131215 RepID=A0ACC2P4W2_9HYME|nr:hypothetical protein QAD02_014229 [Eretmocerus hayati]
MDDKEAQLFFSDLNDSDFLNQSDDDQIGGYSDQDSNGGFHGEFLSEEERIFDKLTNLVLEKYQNESSEHIDRKVVTCLVRTRTYIRLRKLNKRLTSDPFTENAKEKNFKFMK